MHAGEAKNGSSQRAKGGKFVHATVKTIAPAEKQNKNARRRGEERQRPACKRRQIRPRHREDDSAGGETE
ncbi:hypothetical protein [Bianquea renquensis]|uniref:Uncharacterized protein n=1 Tax=Bianquea renquensis TaxID=2763661 RepID=A0A926DVE6_9FIRM|nr:hypothetical protein [Bianquea renquensis]MBC8543960.1 hypothetical protein [Bianquea renquensis]